MPFRFFIVSIIVEVDVVYKVDKLLDTSAGEGARYYDMARAGVFKESHSLFRWRIIGIRLRYDTYYRAREGH